MLQSTVQLFTSIIEESGDEDLRIRENYSGRGMMGKTCTGIVGDQRSIIALIAEAGVKIGTDQAEAAREVHDNENPNMTDRLTRRYEDMERTANNFLNDIKHLR